LAVADLGGGGELVEGLLALEPVLFGLAGEPGFERGGVLAADGERGGRLGREEGGQEQGEREQKPGGSHKE
jgi:hypothetical protein